jgi:hypothetical protein
MDRDGHLMEAHGNGMTVAPDAATRLAMAAMVLRREPATPGIVHALTLIESVLPAPGSPERARAYGAARAELRYPESPEGAT